MPGPTLYSQSSSEPNQPPASALRWVAGLGAAFLAARAITTLLAGASWDAPGDGWRSIWQLAIVALLAHGLARPAALRTAVAIVGAIYLACTISELANPDDLLGVIPVDMRDRIVHPALALLSFGTLALTRDHSRDPADAPA